MGLSFLLNALLKHFNVQVDPAVLQQMILDITQKGPVLVQRLDAMIPALDLRIAGIERELAEQRRLLETVHARIMESDNVRSVASGD